MSYRRPEGSDDAPRRRTKQAIERVSPATHRRVLRAYVDWLREKRKLTSSSIERLVATARRLLADWVGSKKACVARLRRLVPEEIERFLVRRRRRLRRCAVLSLHEGTVRFLQFCTAQGWLPPEFPDRVPSLPASRGPTCSRGSNDSVGGRVMSSQLHHAH